jgi:hypothetical protein
LKHSHYPSLESAGLFGETAAIAIFICSTQPWRRCAA